MKFIKLFIVLTMMFWFCIVVGWELTREGMWLWGLWFDLIGWVGGGNFIAITIVALWSIPLWSFLGVLFWLWTETYKQNGW